MKISTQNHTFQFKFRCRFKSTTQKSLGEEKSRGVFSVSDGGFLKSFADSLVLQSVITLCRQSLKTVRNQSMPTISFKQVTNHWVFGEEMSTVSRSDDGKIIPELCRPSRNRCRRGCRWGHPVETLHRRYRRAGSPHHQMSLDRLRMLVWGLKRMIKAKVYSG